VTSSNVRAKIIAWGSAVAMSAVLVAGVVRVAILKLDPPSQLRDAAGSVSSRSTSPPQRGRITDRRGRILATSTIGWRLFADPSLIDDPGGVAMQLSELIDVPPAIIEEPIRQRAASRYAVLVPLLESWQVDLVRAASIPGIALEKRPVRHYPHGEAAAPLLGLVGSEHYGLAGVEYMLDEDLKGQGGTMVRVRDAKGATLWIHPSGYEAATHGRDVQLSIDLVVQEIATRRLAEEIERRNAGGGRIIVANPATGEILAMADLINVRPGWDEQIDDAARFLNRRLGRHRCLSDPYEPGSTFKPFVWSSITELQLVSVDEILPTPAGGPHRTSFGRQIRDAHYYGPSSWRRVLVKSMNSGMAIAAERMTHVQMQAALERFGFGQLTACGLGGESAGIVTAAEDWNDYTQTSVSMGHEIAVTPLQMIRAFAALSRGGVLPDLRLTLDDQRVSRASRPRAIGTETAILTRSIMGEVMTDGTGRRAQSQTWALFGKSGTAQLPRADGKGYHEDRYVSSFIAGAPLDDPRIIALCVIDDPDRRLGHYGGEIAGPVVRDVIDSTLAYAGPTGGN
jgi:cell division protein FtsI/penicillin-binding protein 2